MTQLEQVKWAEEQRHKQNGDTHQSTKTRPDDAQTEGHSRKRRTPPTDEGDPLSPFQPEGQTDLANARRLIKLHGHRLRYCHPQNTCYIWDGKRWREDDTDEISLLAKNVPDLIFKAAAHVSTTTRLSNSPCDQQSARGIKAMIDLAASEPGIAILPDQFDRDP